MGIYNIYNGIQLKIGIVEMKDYNIGDRVSIPDGIYVGYEGAIVIKDGILLETYDRLIDKWGNEIKCDEIIKINNPIGKYLRGEKNNESI